LPTGIFHRRDAEFSLTNAKKHLDETLRFSLCVAAVKSLETTATDSYKSAKQARFFAPKHKEHKGFQTYFVFFILKIIFAFERFIMRARDYFRPFGFRGVN
jgi:hypothetical protein